MRQRVVYGVWLAVAAGWCWRVAYERWPEMRLALGVAALLLMLAVGRLAERLRWRPEARAAVLPEGAVATPSDAVQWVVVRFGEQVEGGPTRTGAGWCELLHCPMGVTGHPDRASAERAAEQLPEWTLPHLFRVER